MKKVIFVGGTAYSGSTLLDMTLANDPRGFSCGEINAVFYPYRPHHLALDELSPRVDWNMLKRGGAAHLYDNLFSRYPDIDFIVDSSKSPLWIAERSADLRRAGIGVENVLIWKQPESFRNSRKRRNRERGWQREWLNYHRYYFSAVDNWRSVRYDDLVTRRGALERVCQAAGVPYFPGKEQFWRKEHDTAFGNARAKIHLFDRESQEYERYKREISATVSRYGAVNPDDGPHQALYLEHGSTQGRGPYRANSSIDQIQRVIEFGDVGNAAFDSIRLAKIAAPLKARGWYHIYQVVKQKYSPMRVRGLLVNALSTPRTASAQ